MFWYYNLIYLFSVISYQTSGPGVNVVVHLDAAVPWQLGFQDPASPIMEGIIQFHNYLMIFIVLIAVAVSWILFRCITLYTEDTKQPRTLFTHSTVLEIIWTIVPAIVLVIVALPSFSLLYAMDEMIDPSLTLKVIGHQWYWSYEYSDYLNSDDDEVTEDTLKNKNFESYLRSMDNLKPGNLRLLEVDNRIILPVNTHIRLIVSSADVLHSWAVPSLGVKVDACPGRLNQTSLYIKRKGVFFGQCSEICGVNHGFMPIVVKSISLQDYLTWMCRED